MKEVITYSLIENDINSDQYYKDIAVFSTKVLENGEKTLGKILNNYIDYIKNNNLEKVRSKEEYLLEILNLGVLWQIYSDDASELLELPKIILNELVELRKHGGVIKSGTDFARGILSTIFLKTNDNLNSDININKYNYKKFINWLKATGEFIETVKRFDNLEKYFNTLEEEQLSEVFASMLTFSIWFSAKSEQILGKYTSNVEIFLETKYESHRFKEDFVFCGRQRVEYHLNMAGAEILNRAFRKDFLNTKFKKLLLPICIRLKPEGQCKAVLKEEGYICSECSNQCAVNELTKLGQTYNFEVLAIPHESSAFKGGKVEYGKVGIVGVACVLNLLNGGWKARSLDLVPQCVILDYCGCKQHWHENGIVTGINVKELKRVFNIES